MKRLHGSFHLAIVLALGLLASCAAEQQAQLRREPEVRLEPLPMCEPPAPQVEAVVQDLQPAMREAHDLYVSGNLDAAMLAFERILAQAEDPIDQLNSLMALGLIRLMPSSRLQDLDAAGLILDEIDKRLKRGALFYANFGQLELLRQIQSYQQRIANLRASNGSLEAELARKEEAIRKLRELTVGGNLSQ